MDAKKEFKIIEQMMQGCFTQDDEWKTINGTHVNMDPDGNVTKGPEGLRKWSEGKSGGGSSKSGGSESWEDKIDKADDLDKLNKLIEDLADTDIDNDEYERLFAKALKKAQNWDPSKR